MKFIELLKEDKNRLASFSLLIVTAIITTVGWFLLPGKIFVELFSNTPTPETSKTLFLSVGIVVVALSAAMCFFTENIKKWLAAETVLSLAFVGCIVYNLIVL